MGEKGNIFLDFWLHGSYNMCNQKRGDEVNAKMGRPTDAPKTIQTRIRMNEHEAAILNECANILNVTKTDVIVMGIKKVYADIKK